MAVKWLQNDISRRVKKI